MGDAPVRNMMFVVLCCMKTVLCAYDTCRLLVSMEKKNLRLLSIGLVMELIAVMLGFLLPRHLLKQWQQYDGRIAQVVDLYKGSESPTKRRKNARNYGCCEAVLIDYCEEDSRRSMIASGNDNDDEDHNKQQSHKDYDNAGAKRH